MSKTFEELVALVQGWGDAKGITGADGREYGI